MKEIIKKILPNGLFRLFYFIKKKMRFIPENERISFNTNSIYSGHFKTTYRGIPAIRCPFDYVIYQMIISEIKPDLVIEIGTNYGGSTLYLADLMQNIGNGIIHTIDIEDRVGRVVKNHPRIKHFVGGWQGYDLVNTKGYKKILVIEDSSHMYEDTLGALNKFSPIVSVDSYFIVEDGIVDELGKKKGFHGGPLRAIREFLKLNNSFEIDRKYCDMFGKNATFNVNGYLKRNK